LIPQILFAETKLTVSACFYDHMVIQREQPVSVWGEAEPADMITLSFAGQTKAVEINSAGQTN
jgi:sialate O-acetylesterase